MSEYEHTLDMRAAPDAVFAFVADVRNMPKYLPTTHHAESQGEDRVRVKGEANEHAYDSDGYLRADPSARRLEWGADEDYYDGWMQVHESAAGSRVTVHITLKGTPPGADPEKAPPGAAVQEGLEKSLASIRNHVEGTGGKEEPAAAT